MKKIVFIWSQAFHEGLILSQEPCSIQGQRTVIQVFDGPKFFMYGKCQVGMCGPFCVVSITDQLCLPPSPLAKAMMAGIVYEDGNIMSSPHRVSMDYRDRWSELPEGQCELLAGDIVDLISNPGIGSLTVRKANGKNVSVAGFSGYILRRINL